VPRLTRDKIRPAIEHGIDLKPLISLGFCGGRSRARTYDPLIKSQLLYQLSYAPVRHKTEFLNQPEPITGS
jgi:hypothetical protein